MKRYLPITLSLSVLILALVIKVLHFPMVDDLQLRVFDTFQAQHPRTYTPQPVKIIDIDDESLRRLGQWPWPRTQLATLVSKLSDHGSAAIILDIVFPETDRTSPRQIVKSWGQEKTLAYLLKTLPDHDQLFVDAIEKANVSTGFVLTEKPTAAAPLVKSGFAVAGGSPLAQIPAYKGAVTTLPAMEQKAMGNGALNSSPDRDGILRKMPLLYRIGEIIYPTLTAEALRIAQGASGYVIKSVGASGETDFSDNTGVTAVKIGGYEIPTDISGKYWIYYTHYVAERYIPAWTLFEPGFDTSLIEGNIILVGTSASGLMDIRATPLNPVTSGVEVHAQAIEQVLTGEFLTRPDWMFGAEISLMVLVGLLLIIVMAKLTALWGAVFTVCVLTGAIMFSWHAFINMRILIDPVTPSIAILFLYLSSSLHRFIISEMERKQVRNAFSHYMSPALVAELAANPEKLTLGGETKNLTILFCDIRGFTTISEQYDAHGLTKFMNRFLTPLSRVILAHHGTIDKYIGDCIMAFWNAPLDDPHHAENSCRAALSMLTELELFNQQQQKEAEQENRPFIPVNIGIGLNTGDCCVGNMGSEQRFDYSVLGDDVNLASRLEGQSKNYGVSIVLGESTKKMVPDFTTLELDLIRVKGKTKPVRIFALLGDETLKQDEEFLKLKEIVKMLHEHHRTEMWDLADQTIKEGRMQCLKVKAVNLDGFFDLYAQRIKHYRKNPPPRDWGGVHIADSK